MFEVRVTMLEKFRRFRDQVSESYDTEQSVVDSLTGKFEGNDLTNIGTAFHYVVEKGAYGKTVDRNLIYAKWGVLADDSQIKAFYLHAEDMQPFIPEVRLPKLFNSVLGEITISGCTDVLQGNVLRDTKCKFSPPKMVEYMDSYQWRIYLSIFGLDRFIYDVFEFSGHKECDERDVTNCTLKQHEPFECIRYENMENDIQTLINDFCEWIRFRGFEKYITKK